MSLDLAVVKEEDGASEQCVSREMDWACPAAGAEHEVKEEPVLSPDQLQPSPGTAPAVQTLTSEADDTVKQEPVNLTIADDTETSQQSANHLSTSDVTECDVNKIEVKEESEGDGCWLQSLAGLYAERDEETGSKQMYQADVIQTDLNEEKTDILNQISTLSEASGSFEVSAVHNYLQVPGTEITTSTPIVTNPVNSPSMVTNHTYKLSSSTSKHTTLGSDSITLAKIAFRFAPSCFAKKRNSSRVVAKETPHSIASNTMPNIKKQDASVGYSYTPPSTAVRHNLSPHMVMANKITQSSGHNKINSQLPNTLDARKTNCSKPHIICRTSTSEVIKSRILKLSVYKQNSQPNAVENRVLKSLSVKMIIPPQVTCLTHPLALTNHVLQPSAVSNIRSHPSAVSNIRSHPSAVSNISSHPSAVSNIWSQPSAVSNISLQPSVVSNIWSQPSAVSNIRSQPSVVSNIRSQPSVVSNIRSQISAVSNIRSQPSVVSNIRSQTSVVSNIRSHPSAVSNIRSQPSAVSNIRSQPSAVSNIRSQTSAVSNIWSQPSVVSNYTSKPFVVSNNVIPPPQPGYFTHMSMGKTRKQVLNQSPLKKILEKLKAIKKLKGDPQRKVTKHVSESLNVTQKPLVTDQPLVTIKTPQPVIPDQSLVTIKTPQPVIHDQSLVTKTPQLEDFLKPSFVKLERPKLLTCFACKEQFHQKSDFVKHVFDHKSKRMVPCRICKKLVNCTRLKIHMRAIHGPRLFWCDTCGKKFAEKSALIDHLRIHTGEKPYWCKICKTSYRTSSNFVSHNVKHKDLKPHVCNICDKEFQRRTSLRKHLKIHLGVRPYKCLICEKLFYQRYDLDCHIKVIHTGERPYVCEICKKGFALRWHRNQHMREVHAKQKKTNKALKKLTRRDNLQKSKINKIRNKVDNVTRKAV